jgi:hypothetical protein
MIAFFMLWKVWRVGIVKKGLTKGKGEGERWNGKEDT